MEVGVGLGWSLSWGCWNGTAEARSEDSKGSKGKWTREITTIIKSIQQRGVQSIWQPVQRRPGLRSWRWLQVCEQQELQPIREATPSLCLTTTKHRKNRENTSQGLYSWQIYIYSLHPLSHTNWQWQTIWCQRAKAPIWQCFVFKPNANRNLIPLMRVVKLEPDTCSYLFL